MMDFMSLGNMTAVFGNALANDAFSITPPTLFSIDLIPQVTNCTINKNGYSIVQSTDSVGDYSQDFKA